MISRFIKAEVGVICRSRRLRQVTPAKSLIDNSRYHAKTEFNNYFIIHTRFIRASYKFNHFDKMLELFYFISKMLLFLLASAHYS